MAELLGLDAEVVGSALAAAIGQGRVAGARGIYMVTAAGREWLASGYPVRYAGLRADASADAAYARFERINRELLAVLTDWQSIPSAGERVPNDHSDAEYDAKVIDRLGALHDRADRVFEHWSPSSPGWPATGTGWTGRATGCCPARSTTSAG